MPAFTVRLMEVIEGQSEHEERGKWENIPETQDEIHGSGSGFPIGTSSNHLSWYVTCTHDGRDGWQEPPIGSVERIHIENILP